MMDVSLPLIRAVSPIVLSPLALLLTGVWHWVVSRRSYRMADSLSSPERRGYFMTGGICASALAVFPLFLGTAGLVPAACLVVVGWAALRSSLPDSATLRTPLRSGLAGFIALLVAAGYLAYAYATFSKQPYRSGVLVAFYFGMVIPAVQCLIVFVRSPRALFSLIRRDPVVTHTKGRIWIAYFAVCTLMSALGLGVHWGITDPLYAPYTGTMTGYP